MGELKKLRIAGTENEITPYTAADDTVVITNHTVKVNTNKIATKTDLDGKVDKETGKGLSTNDFTTAEKNKLAGIEAQANKTVVDDELSDESENPVQNKVITGKIGDLKAEINLLSGNILYPVEGSGGRPAGYVDIDTGVTWEAGGINGSTGEPTGNNYYIRSSDFISFDSSISQIHIAYASDNISAEIVWYNSSFERTGASGSIDSIVPYDFNNPPAANRVYWKFVLRYKQGSGMYPDNTLPTLLKIQYYDPGEPATQTDRKNDIEDALLNYGKCILTKGDYYVSGVSMPVGSKLRGIGEDTSLYLMASVTSGSAIVPNGDNTISDMKIKRENGYSAKPSSGTAGTDFGMSCKNNVNIIRIVNCDFEGFSGAGIYGFGSSSNDCLSAMIDNCRFKYCTTGIWFYGGMEYNSVSNCVCNSCYYGVHNQGGNNLFSNCHFDKNTIGWYQYGIGVTPANLGHGSAVGCTFNHNTSYSVFLQGGDNGFVFSACQLWYGEVVLRSLKGILFNGCELGGVTVPITLYGSASKGHRFANCTFNVQPTLNLQSSATADGIIASDNYLFDGTAVTFAA